MFKREHEILAKYERTHPHFLRYLALDAVVSVVIVLAGFQIYTSVQSPSRDRIDSGQLALTSSQLIKHLREEAVTVYWLGSVRGDKYTINHEEAGVADLFYLPEGANPSNHSGFAYEIKTYQNQNVWDAHTHTSLATTNTQVVFVNKNISIRINPTSMKGVIATFVDKPEILAIAYPKPQTLKSMIENVESLTLVG